MKYKIFYFIIIAIFFSSCTLNRQQDNNTNPPKYIFYFIGDGMGLAHTSLSEAYLANKNGEIGAEPLLMNTFPVHGLVNTYCQTRQITGSAAAGTALSTGEKTKVDVIAKDSSLTRNLESVFKKAKKINYKIGVISTVSIDHATPASFYANSDLRKNYYEIACQLPKSNFDFFGGGGFKYPTGRQHNQEDAYELAKKSGYNIVHGIPNVGIELPIFHINKYLGPDAEMPYAIDPNYSKGDSLKNILEFAISSLDNENGFMMMIESGKIDWAAHRNDAATINKEVLEMDMAVRVAYEFYKMYPDETLIIVTADHETGGLALGLMEHRYKSYFENIDFQKYSQRFIGDSIAKIVNAETTINNLVEILNNQFLTKQIDFTNQEKELLTQALRVFQEKEEYLSKQEIAYLYDGYNPIAMAITQIINKRSAIGFTTWNHTACPVPIRAIGNGSSMFDGYMDNTDIPKRLYDIISE